MQFAVLFWFKEYMHRGEPDQDLYDMGTLRLILTVQAVLTMYLCYISFYSEKNASWDRIGYWMHLVVALLTYFILPVAVIVVIALNASDTIDTAMGPYLCATAITNFLVALWGLIQGRKDYMATYRWYSVRQ